MKNNRKNFIIPRIEEERGTSRDQDFGVFVGSYSGRNAQNKEVYPYVEYGNNARQYQGLDSNFTNNSDQSVDKYSPSRIPSYLRREDSQSGISRNNINYLKGEKMTIEEMRRTTGVVVNNPNNNYEPKQYEEKYQNEPSYENPKEVYVDNFEKQNNYEEDVKPVVRNYKIEETYEYSEEYDDGLEEDYQEDIPQNPTLTKMRVGREEESSFSSSSTIQRRPSAQKDPIMGIKSEESSDDFYKNELDFVHVQNPHNQVKESIKAKIEPAKPVKKPSPRKRKYSAPPLDILKKNGLTTSSNMDVNFQINTINSTLEEFRIGGHVVRYVKGPTVTQFEVKLDPGVRVSKVEGISKNLQMNLASDSIRIEAPIPGKPSVGIEVPNPVKDKVLFGDLVSKKEYLNDGKPLNIVLGQQIDGSFKYLDITSMPHALVAGTTGSGKTICLYSIITSILYKASPEEVKIIMIDPKSNEMTFFSDIPHLACPIIDDPKVATASIKWAVDEMQRRYQLLKSTRKRTIVDYNNYIQETGNGEKMPYIVIVIDEFADLMNTASDSFETNVQRLTQKARSAGIHMVIATQRPSTDVIKGTIKANITTRIAFNVKSPTDSITILDHVGADKLLGKGDMLYTNGGNDIRVQGAFITEEEIEQVADYLVKQNDVDYMFTLDELKVANEGGFDDFDDDDNALFEKVARHVVTYRNASMNQIQRTFNIGYNRADDLMSQLEEMGIVSPVIPGKQRSVLIDIDELNRILFNNRQ